MIATTISQFFSNRCLSCHRSVLACGKSSFRGVHWNNKTGEINFLCIVWDSRLIQFINICFPSFQVRDRSDQTTLVNIFSQEKRFYWFWEIVFGVTPAPLSDPGKTLRWENYHIDSGRNVFVISRWYWLNFEALKSSKSLPSSKKSRTRRLFLFYF